MFRLLLILSTMIAIMTGLEYGRAYAKPEDYGLSGKLTNLTDLGPVLRRPDLTSTQRTEVLVSWLVEERQHPSRVTQGLGGGDIDSGYIQAQIVKALAEVGDLLMIDGLTESLSGPPETADPTVVDALILAVGLMGDRSKIPGITDILATHREGFFRTLAAEALGSLGATEVKPTLEKALADSFAVMGGAGDIGGPRKLVYPVREAAEVALRVLSNPAAMEFTKQKTEAFAKRKASAGEEDQRSVALAAQLTEWIRAKEEAAQAPSTESAPPEPEPSSARLDMRPKLVGALAGLAVVGLLGVLLLSVVRHGRSHGH